MSPYKSPSKLLLLVTGLFLPALLSAAPIFLPPPPVPASAGVGISLTTAGYQFTVSGSSQLSGATSFKVLQKAILTASTGFAATVSLVNHTPTPISFTFPTAADATTHFVFQLTGSDGSLLWASNESADPTPALTDGTLPGHSSWKLTARVPLTIDGTALSSGTYGLTAFVNATPPFSASATIQVVDISGSSNPPPLSGTSGIAGIVQIVSEAGPIIVGRPFITYTPVPGETVNVYPANTIIPIVPVGISLTSLPSLSGSFTLPAPVATTTTDDNGNFQVSLPPGNYIVRAQPAPSNDEGGFTPATVTDGSVTDVTVDFFPRFIPL